METRRIKGGVILPPGNPEPNQPPQTKKTIQNFCPCSTSMMLFVAHGILKKLVL